MVNTWWLKLLLSSVLFIWICTCLWEEASAMAANGPCLLIECGRSDKVSLPRFNYKGPWLPPWVLFLTVPGGSQLPCNEVVLRRGPWDEGRRPANHHTSELWGVFPLQWSLQMRPWPQYSLTTTSWETFSQRLSATLGLDSWPTETMR